MHFSATFLAALSAISIVSASPISARQDQGTHANPKNAIPAGSPSLIATPAANDLAACLADCKGNAACTAYTFESGVCKLFGGSNAKRQDQGTHAAPINSQPAGNPSPISTPAANDLAACLADCKGNSACTAYTFESGVCKLFGASNNKRQAQGSHAAPINSQPAGNPSPISTPAANDLAACLADCKGNAACTAYTFESGVCRLFGATNNKRQQQGGTHAAPVNFQLAGNPTPIATPAVTDLAACLSACKGNSACTAYTFSSGVCKLFDGASSKARRQQNGATGNTGNTGASTSNTGSSNTGTSNTGTSNTGTSNTGTGSPTGTGSTGTSNTGTGSNGSGSSTTTGTHAAPVNQQPSGNPTPISTPTATSLDACLAACQGNSACVAYTFESNVCKLFS